MNYKEKYEKALKAASQWHKDGIGDVKTIVECIFPELKESEDERIRKEILEYFQQFENEELRGVNISDWIAWLEKQGEKKSVSIKETELNSLAFLTELGYTCIPPKEEQNAWSEEDERIYNEILDFFLGDIGTRCTTIDKQRHFVYWLKSLKPCWKPTEEQMEALKCSYKSYIIDGKERRTLESLYNDLKSL